jgi:hypothetical protein
MGTNIFTGFPGLFGLQKNRNSMYNTTLWFLGGKRLTISGHLLIPLKIVHSS